jgi:hypothetical protein
VVETLDAHNSEELILRIAEFVTQIQLAKEAIQALPKDEGPAHLLEHFPFLS